MFFRAYCWKNRLLAEMKRLWSYYTRRCDSPFLTATVEIRRESDADREEAKKLEEALGTHVDRVLQALEARQRQHMQQMLGALNSTVVDILTSTLLAAGV